MVLKTERVKALCKQRDAINVLLQYGYEYLRPTLEDIENELEQISNTQAD